MWGWCDSTTGRHLLCTQPIHDRPGFDLQHPIWTPEPAGVIQIPKINQTKNKLQPDSST